MALRFRASRATQDDARRSRRSRARPAALAVAAVAFVTACGEDEPGGAAADAGAGSPDAGPVLDAALATDGATGDAADDAPDLPRGLARLLGDDPTDEDEELAVLDGLVADAEIVGVGESIHTVGTYYRMKHRVFRYLVERHGFRAFAIENPWTDAELLAEHVRSCDGDALAGVRKLFGVWSSEELLALIDWMCVWNTEHPGDPLTFFAADAQQPWDDGAALRAFFERVAPDDAPRLAGSMARCNASTITQLDYYTNYELHRDVTADDHAACLTALDEIDALLVSRRAEWTASSSAEQLELATVHALGLRGWQGARYHAPENERGAEPDMARSFGERDRAWVEIFRILRRFRVGTQKTFLWAHNSHIARAYHLARGAFRGARSMGTYLSDELGERYVSIGQISHAPEIDWPGVGVGPIPAPYAGSAEAALHELGEPTLFVDLDDTRGWERETETVYLQFERMVPAEQFDALFYFDHAAAMTPLSW